MLLLVRPNEPNQPDPNLTQILTLRAQPYPKMGRVQIVFIKYIIGLNPNLNPFLCQLDLFLDPEGQSDPLGSKNWAKNWVEPKKTGREWPQLLLPHF